MAVTQISGTDAASYIGPDGKLRDVIIVRSVSSTGGDILGGGGSKAEDSAAASGDAGSPALFVRTPATPAAQTSTDGDYGFPAIDSYGNVKTLNMDPATGGPATLTPLGQALMSASIPVTIASNQTWTGSTNLGSAEDAAHTSGDVGIAGLGVRNDTRQALTSTDLDYGNFGLDGLGNQHVRQALLATSDLTPVIVNMTTATTTAIVAAGGAGVTTRVHRMRLRIAAAQTLTVKDGTTTLETFTFAGAGSVTLDFSSRYWYKTTANAALNFTTTTTGAVEGVVEYVSGAL